MEAAAALGYWLLGVSLCAVTLRWIYQHDPGCLGKGKITRLMMRYFLPRGLWRYPTIMFSRMMCIGLAASPISFAVGGVVARSGMLTWVGIIAILLDDYFSHDDRFKRWFEGVRNKAKWKMKLPVLRPQPGGTA